MTRRLLWVVPVLLLGLRAVERRWLCDDAYIDLQVARNLVQGRGPVTNPTERVEAYTNPLWVALLAAWSALGGPLETGAVGLGILLGTAGLALGIRAADRLAAQPVSGPEAEAPAWRLPLGALVVASLGPAADFVGSGLETGLGFAWLGGSYASLAEVARRGIAGGRLPPLAAILVGLGPLVRPDLGLFAAAFACVLVLAAWDRREGRPARLGALLGAGLALPLGYQVFRMGYFAGLVPNTALAKEASLANWPQGLVYARDFFGTYLLGLPLAVLVIPGALALRRAGRAPGRLAAALLVAPAAAGLAHMMWVIRLGGDFMHARLFLPGLFGLLLPVMQVALRARRERPGDARLAILVCVPVLTWAAGALVWLRPPYGDGVGPALIVDERRVHQALAGRPNPVMPEDYGRLRYVVDARQIESYHGRLGSAAGGRSRVLLLDRGDAFDPPPAPPPEARVLPLEGSVPRGVDLVIARHNLGLARYLLDPRIHVVDRLGLTDPLAARLRLGRRGRPGHEKWLSWAWIAARFAEPRPADTWPAPLDGARVAAARRALGCGILGELDGALREPMSARRFLRNLRLAWPLYRLRVAEDPPVAARELCGS